MKKEEIIKRYGKAEYKRRSKQPLIWNKKHPERHNATTKRWQERNPERIREIHREYCRKGGKYYEKSKIYKMTGLQGRRNRIRMRHGSKWRPYKRIVAPESQIHHQWRPGSARYDCVALVEKNQHQYGILEVIEVLEGGITLFTEKEVRER